VWLDRIVGVLQIGPAVQHQQNARLAKRLDHVEVLFALNGKDAVDALF
jgi:hypothetical protein